MTQNPLANIPPVVKNLLIINIICFIPVLMYSRPNELGPVEKYLGLYYFNSPMFKPWQVVTYMFIHGGFMHIFFNMFALYSFGTIVEQTLGSKRFFNYYFICGFGAIALQMLVQAIEVHSVIGSFTTPNPEIWYNKLPLPDAQTLYDIFNGPMVGASGAIFGLLIAFGMLYPNMELMIMFIPVPVKAKYIIPVYIVVELFLGVQKYAGDSVAHFAHLGGALIGFILIKIWGIRKPNNLF
jgi:membrane associated rhomboid family serine protease